MSALIKPLVNNHKLNSNFPKLQESAQESCKTFKTRIFFAPELLASLEEPLSTATFRKCEYEGQSPRTHIDQFSHPERYPSV